VKKFRGNSQRTAQEATALSSSSKFIFHSFGLTQSLVNHLHHPGYKQEAAFKYGLNTQNILVKSTGKAKKRRPSFLYILFPSRQTFF